MAVAVNAVDRKQGVPTIADLKIAHDEFLEKEARDLFYTVATDLVGRALRGTGPVGIGGAVAVLLATWNRRFYQKGRRCDREHVDAIDKKFRTFGPQLTTCRERRIETLADDELDTVKTLFEQFEPLLGRVGVAKCFHLLAPQFFPLWDNTIASNYHMPLSGWDNARRYGRFMLAVKDQLAQLGGAASVEKAVGVNALKALDEYNYWVAKGWNQGRS